MENYVIYDLTTGEIVISGSGPVGIAAQQVGLLPDTDVLIGFGRVGLDYVDALQIKPRPTVPAIYPDTAPAPLTLNMTGLPAGYTITATNEAGETVTTSDPADPIILADPETYIVQIDPPWPYLPETLTIEVT